ncbi:MAG: hypothetical protein WA629_15800 [Candidatus Aquilonibacter sp.]
MLPARPDFQELKARLHAAGAASRTGREALFPSAIADIDALLGGGFPCGSLVTLEGCGTAGARSIAAVLLAQATRNGLAAVIDGGELYPPALEAAGVRLDRLLIVPAATPVRAARAADMLLRSRTTRVVVMAVCGGTPGGALRAAVWTRLANLAQKAGALLVVLCSGTPLTTRSIAALSAAATVCLSCRVNRPVHTGTRGIWGIFTGFELRAELRKHKFRKSLTPFVVNELGMVQ